MPELPEVETIRRSLLPLIQGQEIINTEILHPDVLINHDQRPLHGWKIAGRRRRGKYLLIDLVQASDPAEELFDGSSAHDRQTSIPN